MERKTDRRRVTPARKYDETYRVDRGCRDDVPPDVKRRPPGHIAPDDAITPIPKRPARRTDLKPMKGW